MSPITADEIPVSSSGLTFNPTRAVRERIPAQVDFSFKRESAASSSFIIVFLLLFVLTRENIW